MKKTNIKRFLFVILFVIFLVGIEGTPVNASNTTEYYQEISELAGIQFFSYDNLTEFSLRKKDII